MLTINYLLQQTIELAFRYNTVCHYTLNKEKKIDLKIAFPIYVDIARFLQYTI